MIVIDDNLLTNFCLCISCNMIYTLDVQKYGLEYFASIYWNQ